MTFSDGKNNFAKLQAGFEISVGGGGFGEGKNPVNDGFETAGSNEPHHAVKLGLRAHIGAQQRKLAAKEETEVNFGVVASGGAASDKPASGGQAREAVVPGGCANVLEDDVHAAFVGDASDFVADFLCFVIDEVVSTKLLCFL